MKSLLERAKLLETKRNNKRIITPDKVELALAWLKGEVGITQASRALKLKTINDAYIPIATALRRAYEDGSISIKK